MNITNARIVRIVGFMVEESISISSTDSEISTQSP